MAKNTVSAIRIGLLDPLRVLEMSKGEVLHSKTFDAKSQKPYIDGLFCKRIFGADSGVCICGNYHRNYRRKPVVCEKCGVTVQSARLNRERFGHIVLQEPVIHVWFRSAVSSILNIPPKKLSDIIEYRAYVVTEPGETNQKKMNMMSTNELYARRAAGEASLRAETGGNAILNLLKSINLNTLYTELKKKEGSRRISKRLQIIRNLLHSSNKAHWMVLQILPVMPATLRPTLFMQDGTITTSDITELYLKVIRKNNRLKQLKSFGAPNIILDNDRRLLQLAVDALLDNGRTNLVKDRSNKKVLQSISDLIEKKTGRMRRNLLGKRVDYSGRSVIAVGPKLKLDECALPFDLAMRMFKPFVYSRLLRRRLAINLYEARALVLKRTHEAIDCLAQEMNEKYVLLNRAPSLHRMSIQAFRPQLVKERAILLHPLVCSSFNADFDGDQMGVHLPLTREAQKEARELICTAANLFSPANGKLVVSPSQDIVLGIYYLTLNRNGCKGEGMLFADREDVLMAISYKITELQAVVKVRIDNMIVETTPGRVIFNSIFPEEMPFALFNKTIRKKDIAILIERCYEIIGRVKVVAVIDAIKDMGFQYATVSGISLCSADITVPEGKKAVIREAEEKIKEIAEEYRIGQRTDTERYNLVKETWIAATEKIKGMIIENLGVQPGEILTDEQKKERREFNSLFIMADSGARGSVGQISQAAGMRGLMTKPTGEVVEMPIKSNLKEGLTYHEFLLACHGARKGRADGALKTATAGYFTRRLVESAIDVIVTEKDCNCSRGVDITALVADETVVIPLEDRIRGRVLARAAKDDNQVIIAEANTLIDRKLAKKIFESNIDSVCVRSPLTCRSKEGICAMCFGEDLSKKRLVQTGEGVGIIAAQSIGEPGTQLTLRTFHTGGSAGGGLRKNAISSADKCSVSYQDVATVTDREGKRVVISKSGRLMFTKSGKEKDGGKLPYGAVLFVENGATVEADTVIAKWETLNTPTIATAPGVAEYRGILEGRTMMLTINEDTGLEEKTVTVILKNSVPRIAVGDKDYFLPVGAVIVVDDGAKVLPGDILAKVPSKKEKSADITQGLGRVIELFENRRIENTALLAEIDGEIKVHPPSGGKIKIELTSGKYTASYHVAVDRHVNYCSGDKVKAGDLIVDGVIHADDMLAFMGLKAAARYITDEIQKVYRAQGVEIADKHFEIIISQMFKTVEILDPGDTHFVAGERVLKKAFMRRNNEVTGKKASARQVLIGLTKVSLSSDSWLSASSFQNTADVLTNAALRGQTDYIQGIKEHVITGQKIPLGVEVRDAIKRAAADEQEERVKRFFFGNKTI